jgi:hypothetical protein
VRRLVGSVLHEKANDGFVLTVGDVFGRGCEEAKVYIE